MQNLNDIHEEEQKSPKFKRALLNRYLNDSADTDVSEKQKSLVKESDETPYSQYVYQELFKHKLKDRESNGPNPTAANRKKLDFDKFLGSSLGKSKTRELLNGENKQMPHLNKQNKNFKLNLTSIIFENLTKGKNTQQNRSIATSKDMKSVILPVFTSNSKEKQKFLSLNQVGLCTKTVPTISVINPQLTNKSVSTSKAVPVLIYQSSGKQTTSQKNSETSSDLVKKTIECINRDAKESDSQVKRSPGM